MAQPPELTGHVLGGKYRLVRAVSEGPRQVYEARHERFSGRFAVKLWPPTTPWEAFWRGAEVAMTLRHPGVMQALDFNCQPGVPPFLVLEWVDGTRLSEIIAEAGLMPIERVAPLVESAAWAIASAHQQGVVHLELRPDEVFVVHAPGTMREWVKVAGFGVSAALSRTGTSPPSRYRAPEQKAAETGVHDDGDDPQSDQYSLAAIAYEMLAGIPPFHDDGAQAEPAPISDLAPGVSPAVDAAVRQALAVDPEQRFAGVLEFARALRDAIDGASPEVLRRRSAAATPRDRRVRVLEAVSPFFNPLQGRASDVFRRVATTTARLRTLAARSAPRIPGGPAARIAIAGAALLVAVTGTSLVLRQRTPAHDAPTAPRAPVVASTPPPKAAAAPPLMGPPPPEPGATPPAPSQTAAASTASTPSVADKAKSADAPAPKRAPLAAWARLGAGAARTAPGLEAAAQPAASRASPTLASAAPPKPGIAARSKQAVAATSKPAAATPPRPAVATASRPADATPPKAAVATESKPAPSVAVESGKAPASCTISVGSTPPADVWLDDRSLGKRTPIVRYPAACGDHKLALKRDDLDLYQMEIVTLRAGAPFKKVYPLQ
ncbi:MAG TPA: protein kinase [Polyangia bacterium]|jgi:serine/threonine-protein kinase|nr:protein kinase [Polyangia bacterium]